MIEDIRYKKALSEHLAQFVTDDRKEKFEKIIQQRTRHICVVLEDVFQPHNASAVLRSCDCFGIQDVHVIENRNEFAPVNDIAMGAFKWLDIHRYNKQGQKASDAYEILREKGYRIVATSPHTNGYMLDELPLDHKTALVFGTEMEGLTDDALSAADDYVQIPMYGFTESYNISVSVALCLFHLSEKLRKSGIDYTLTEQEKTEVRLQWMLNTLKRSDNFVLEFNKNWK